MTRGRVSWRRLELRGFGPFAAGVGVGFRPGLNVLAAPNETGKSTLLAGLQAVLFGLEGGESRTAFSRGRFRSWSGEACGGCLVLEAADRLHLIVRDFERQRVEVWEGPPATGRPAGGAGRTAVSDPDLRAWPRGWVQLLAGPHNPRGQRNDPRYEEWLERTVGFTGRDLFSATFCLGQGLLPGGGEAFPAAGDGWALPAAVQVLLAGSGGRTVAEALDRLAARVRELTMRPASRYGLPGRDLTKPRRVEELEERVAALEERLVRGRRSLDASEGLRAELARAEARERDVMERLDHLRRTEQAFAERRLALERLRAAEAEQERLDADWRAWEDLRRREAEARAALARDFPWSRLSGDEAVEVGRRLAALREVARERERLAAEEAEVAERRRAAAAALAAALRESSGGPSRSAAGLGWATLGGVVAGLALALLAWLAGVPRGTAAGLALALGSAVGFAVARAWLARSRRGSPAAGRRAPPGAGPAAREGGWGRLPAGAEAARAIVAEAAVTVERLAERRREAEARWDALAAPVGPLLAAHGGDPERALAAWTDFEAAAQRVETVAAAGSAILARHGAGGGDDLRRLLLASGNEVQERLRAWEDLLARHPGLPGRHEPAEEVEGALRRVRAEREAAEGMLAEAREEGVRLRRALAEAEAGGQDNVARLELELAALRGELAGAREEAAALALAHAELAGAYDEYRESHRARLADLASGYFSTLTSRPGRRVALGEDFSVEVREADGRRCAVSQLSRGAADQLALSLRLAVADLLGADLVLPLILDDPFGSFDEERLAEARRLLQAVAEERQVILVTHRVDQLSWGRPVAWEEPVLLAGPASVSPAAAPSSPRAAAGGGA